MIMKGIVWFITGLAFMGILFAGATMDSENLRIPMMVLAPCLVWFGLLGWVNNR